MTYRALCVARRWRWAGYSSDRLRCHRYGRCGFAGLLREPPGEKSGDSMRKHIMLGASVLIAVLAGSAVGVNATDDTDPDDAELDGLVTEEVEPGVERIIRDDAFHDLDDTHPTYRYDMDDVFVTP